MNETHGELIQTRDRTGALVYAVVVGPANGEADRKQAEATIVKLVDYDRVDRMMADEIEINNRLSEEVSRLKGEIAKLEGELELSKWPSSRAAAAESGRDNPTREEIASQKYGFHAGYKRRSDVVFGPAPDPSRPDLVWEPAPAAAMEGTGELETVRRDISAWERQRQIDELTSRPAPPAETGEKWNPFYHKVYMRNSDGSYTGLVGVFLTTPDGATAMQAESAAAKLNELDAAYREQKSQPAAAVEGTGERKYGNCEGPFMPPTKKQMDAAGKFEPKSGPAAAVGAEKTNCNECGKYRPTRLVDGRLVCLACEQYRQADPAPAATAKTPHLEVTVAGKCRPNDVVLAMHRCSSKTLTKEQADVAAAKLAYYDRLEKAYENLRLQLNGDGELEELDNLTAEVSRLTKAIEFQKRAFMTLLKNAQLMEKLSKGPEPPLAQADCELDKVWIEQRADIVKWFRQMTETNGPVLWYARCEMCGKLQVRTYQPGHHCIACKADALTMVGEVK